MVHRGTRPHLSPTRAPRRAWSRHIVALRWRPPVGASADSRPPGRAGLQRQGDKNKRATDLRTGRTANGNPNIGTARLHTLIDDHSRMTNLTVCEDERPQPRSGSCNGGGRVRRPRGERAASLVRQRVGLPLARLAEGMLPARDHTQAHMSLPAPDQREDRTLPPHPGRRVGLRPLLHLRNRTSRDPARMAATPQPPPAPQRNRHRWRSPMWRHEDGSFSPSGEAEL